MEENLTLNLLQGGTTSVALDADLIASATGLTLTTVENTVESIPADFGVGFDISERSGFVLSSNNDFRGEIEHTGTVTFSNAAGDITTGNFTIAFDPARQTENTSGFYVQSTVGDLLDDVILFDISNPESLVITDTAELNLGGANLLVSNEFASILLDTGLTGDDLTGTDVGDAAINATTIDITDLNPIGIQDGTTSVTLDADLLSESAGLTLIAANGSAEPIPDDFFSVGFDITEESDFLFTVNDGLTTPIAGEIEHTGTVTFSSAEDNIIVGDFTIGFDAARQTENASGFFVENTIEGVVPNGAILFDISNSESLEVSDTGLNVGSADLLVSNEFATILLDTGLAATDLTGADVGDAAIAGVLDSDLF